MRLVLFQPEIPQNTGTLLRVGACLGVGIELIEPLGFIFSERRLARAGMDYIHDAQITMHKSWEEFYQKKGRKRCVLLKAHAQTSYVDFSFQEDDLLIVGKESTGVPVAIEDQCEAHITIPMYPQARSLNMAIAASMILGEGLRQLKKFP